MRGRGVLFAAIALLAVGAIGMVTVVMWESSRSQTWSGRLSADSARAQRNGRFRSNGERIYYTGVGHDGPIGIEWDNSFGGGMMGGRGAGRAGMGCVTCHRANGRGGRISMMGLGRDVPDIRYRTLTSPHDDERGAEPGWTQQQIEMAITSGKEPGGDTLDPFMPRWDMDRQDLSDTLDYLKELSDR